MFHIFEQKFDNSDKEEEYIYNRLDDYTRNTKSEIDAINIIRYLSILKEYIDTKCPKKERNTLRLISLVSSAIDVNKNFITSVDLTFANLLSNEPESYLPVKYTLVKSSIDNDTIYDILLFLKYNLLTTISSESTKENGSAIKEKYKKELDLLDQSINTAEKLIDEEEELEEGNENQPHALSGDLQTRLNKFLEEYKPFAIKAYLDKRIIGQEEAKKTMAVAIYNHILLLAHPEYKLKKNNVLMIGPSGCGKTEIMRVLSEIVPVPISIFDTSGISQQGWKGDKKIKDAVKELVIKTNDAETASCGIIFLDEFDKMCRPMFTSHGENVSVHIQGEALAMIEGCNVEVNLGGEDALLAQTALVNTQNVLFICAGAFQGIEESVKKIKTKDVSIGFGGKAKSTNDQITAKDITKDVIIEFGVTPELAGRLSITTVLHKLTRDDMFAIITKCDNNVLDELKTIAKNGYGIDLEITDKALIKLIDKLCMDVGARGLRSIIFEYFTDILFECSVRENVQKVIIDEDFVAKYVESKLKTKKNNHINNIDEKERD